MKKLFFLLCVAAIAFTSCQETAFSDETAALAGKYQGTFTLIKQNNDSTQSQAKEYTFSFKQNPLNMDNLLFEAVLEMYRVSEGVYQLDENAMTAELLQTAANYFGVNNYVEQYLGTTIEQIKKISAKAEFNGDRVNLKFYYEVELYGIGAEIVIATFDGAKIE